MCGHDTVFVLCGFERACHALFLYRVVCVGFHGVLLFGRLRAEQRDGTSPEGAYQRAFGVGGRSFGSRL